MKKLGILGLGHMGSAILDGALSAMDAGDIIVYDPFQEKMKQQKEEQRGVT